MCCSSRPSMQQLHRCSTRLARISSPGSRFPGPMHKRLNGRLVPPRLARFVHLDTDVEVAAAFRNLCASSTRGGGPRDGRRLSCSHNTGLGACCRQPRFLTEQVRALDHPAPCLWRRGGRTRSAGRARPSRSRGHRSCERGRDCLCPGSGDPHHPVAPLRAPPLRAEMGSVPRLAVRIPPSTGGIRRLRGVGHRRPLSELMSCSPGGVVALRVRLAVVQR
jgi:hypothetical protein